MYYIFEFGGIGLGGIGRGARGFLGMILCGHDSGRMVRAFVLRPDFFLLQME